MSALVWVAERTSKHNPRMIELLKESLQQAITSIVHELYRNGIRNCLQAPQEKAR